MMLSNREDLGHENTKQQISTYRITAEHAPRRLIRAVAMVNAANRTPGKGFETSEDYPVKSGKRIVWYALLILASVSVRLTLWPHTHELFALIGTVFLAALAFNALFGVITRETFCEFFAARIFGVPSCPRLYINRAMRKGQVQEERHTPAG